MALQLEELLQRHAAGNQNLNIYNQDLLELRCPTPVSYLTVK